MEKFNWNEGDFGKVFLGTLQKHGFGVLSKADLEALIFHALKNSSEHFSGLDAYGQAEALRITDSKLKTLYNREISWLIPQPAKADEEILIGYIEKCLQAVLNLGPASELEVHYGDALDRRLLKRAVSRMATKMPGLSASFRLGTDFIAMNEYQLNFWFEAISTHAKNAGELKWLKDEVNRKKRIQDFRNWLQTVGKDVATGTLDIAIRTTLNHFLGMS
jgi:hypothetical protein